MGKTDPHKRLEKRGAEGIDEALLKGSSSIARMRLFFLASDAVHISGHWRDKVRALNLRVSKEGE